MAVETLTDTESGKKCMYCTTSMWAFGGIFYEDEDVEDFLGWLPDDPRKYKDNALEEKISEWRSQKNN